MKALELLGTMLKGDVSPTDATLVSALSAIAGVGSLNKAISRKKGGHPNCDNCRLVNAWDG